MAKISDNRLLKIKYPIPSGHQLKIR